MLGVLRKNKKSLIELLEKNHDKDLFFCFLGGQGVGRVAQK